MTSASTNTVQWLAIKVTSSVLIAMAALLLAWKLYATASNIPLPSKLDVWVWIGSGAMAIHAVEGALAARIARNRDGNPLKIGIYTFFTGMAGLAELYNQDGNDSEAA
ncbi:MAG: hypothetical protein AAF974_05080 [Cyanobacteria bacterium P01_E01_bin.34]